MRHHRSLNIGPDSCFLLDGTKPLTAPLLTVSGVMWHQTGKKFTGIAQDTNIYLEITHLKLQHFPRANELCHFDHHSFLNRPISQIPECTCSTSHNAQFWVEHCGIWNRCILEFAKQVNPGGTPCVIYIYNCHICSAYAWGDIWVICISHQMAEILQMTNASWKKNAALNFDLNCIEVC